MKRREKRHETKAIEEGKNGMKQKPKMMEGKNGMKHNPSVEKKTIKKGGKKRKTPSCAKVNC